MNPIEELSSLIKNRAKWVRTLGKDVWEKQVADAQGATMGFKAPGHNPQRMPPPTPSNEVGSYIGNEMRSVNPEGFSVNELKSYGTGENEPWIDAAIEHQAEVIAERDGAHPADALSHMLRMNDELALNYERVFNQSSRPANPTNNFASGKGSFERPRKQIPNFDTTDMEARQASTGRPDKGSFNRGASQTDAALYSRQAIQRKMEDITAQMISLHEGHLSRSPEDMMRIFGTTDVEVARRTLENQARTLEKAMMRANKGLEGGGGVGGSRTSKAVEGTFEGDMVNPGEPIDYGDMTSQNQAVDEALAPTSPSPWQRFGRAMTTMPGNRMVPDATKQMAVEAARRTGQIADALRAGPNQQEGPTRRNDAEDQRMMDRINTAMNIGGWVTDPLGMATATGVNMLTDAIPHGPMGPGGVPSAARQAFIQSHSGGNNEDAGS